MQRSDQRSDLARRLAHRVSRNPVLRTLRDAARERDAPLWLVGGYVRDAALARPAGDFDLVSAKGTRGWLKWVAERFDTAGFRFRKRGVTTWRFRFDDEPVDWVDAQHRGLAADLERRDFTVNAMAFELGSSQVADPLGGLRDLQRRRLRLCRSDALEEDPIRVLRLARFSAQLGFAIDRKAELTASAETPRLARSAVERIAYEFDRILGCRQPRLALDPVYRWGVIDLLLPEMVPMRDCVAGVDRPGVEEHTLMAIEHTARLPRHRVPFSAHLKETDFRRLLHWALWLHDIAKPATLATLPDGRPSFHGHETVGAKISDRLLKRWKLPARDRERITRLIRLHLRPGHLADSGAGARGLRRLVRDAGGDLPLLVLHAAADALGSGAGSGEARWRRLQNVLRELERTSNALRGVRRRPWLAGNEVMRSLGIEAGPQVGRLLAAMVDAQESGEIRSEEQARSWLASQQAADFR